MIKVNFSRFWSLDIVGETLVDHALNCHCNDNSDWIQNTRLLRRLIWVLAFSSVAKCSLSRQTVIGILINDRNDYVQIGISIS